MKLNIAYPSTGMQKVVEIEDENKLRALYDKRISAEIDGADIDADQFEGYLFKITGGNDKQGFAMMQGVLVNHRVRLLLDKNSKCYRIRRKGERKRKSVRGCIVGADLAVLNLVVLKKGEKEIPGVTDVSKPRRLGPKRASKIRKLFNLSKQDDVRKYVIRRPVNKEGKVYYKSPKIQRLITPQRVQRKRRERQIKRTRWEKSIEEAKEYNVKLNLRLKAQKAARAARVAKRRSVSQRLSHKGEEHKSQ